jgi:hypothetical protein
MGDGNEDGKQVVIALSCALQIVAGAVDYHLPASELLPATRASPTSGGFV